MKLALQGLVVLAAVLVFGGCTALRFTYNNANSLIRYMAWDYVELDDAQSAALQQRVAGLHEWHRANELPMYAEFIEQASARVSKGTTQKDVAWAIEAMRKTYKRMASRSAEEAAPILVTLRPEQIAALEKRLAKNDAKFVREWLSGSAARRERHAMERMVERFEEWTGGLTKPQRDRIERFVRAHPRIQEVRLEDRRRWQKQAVGHIKEFKTAEELASRLASLFSQPDASRNDDYTRETHSWQNDLADLLVDLDRMLSVEQRSRVIRRMARYADDFRALSKGGAEARAPGGASIWFSSAARP